MATLKQDVLRFDVSMDDAVPMRVIQRLADFAGDPEGIVHGKLLLPVEAVSEAFSLHIRHGVPQLTGRFTRIMHTEDVWMLESRCEADLPLESLRT